MRKPRNIIRHNGDRDSEVSNYCPKCGNTSIESDTSETQDFDETGWFYRISMTCKFPGCKHTWYERLSISAPSQKLR